jgi:putative oxidoreductase
MTVSVTTPHTSLRLAAVRVGSLATRALVAVAYIFAGSANLSGTPSAIEMFEAVGVGQWLRYLAALVEVAGAAMLLLPGFIGLGALLLATTMFCALLGHFFVFGDSPVGTLVLFAATTAILWYRRRELLALNRRYFDRRRPERRAEFLTWLALVAGIAICAIATFLT